MKRKVNEMASCVECKKSLSSGLVVDSECYGRLKEASRERDRYKKALEAIKAYGSYTGYLAEKALEDDRQ